jgi:hypothetical protein
MNDLLYLNPFVANFVHEAEIWGDEDTAFQDVVSIHADVFETLLGDLRAVAADPRHTTRVRFLVGAGGSGKSHLFSRLRRRVGDGAIFAFASNPPTRSSAFLLWVLDKVVFGLQRPRLASGKQKPYSQLEALLYLLLLKQGLGLDEDTLDGLHEFWVSVSEAKREDFLRRMHEKLVARGYEAQSLRGTLAVLRPQTREVAFRWLSGSTNLLDEELGALGQQHPIEDDQAKELLKRLGVLSRLAEAPLVLVLDQLDLMTSPDQIDEIQRLLFTLINESSHWYVVIGLIGDKFALWQERLTSALRTRLEAPGGGLPSAELQHLTDVGQIQALIRQRLASAALSAARAASGATDELFPLTDSDLETLAASGPVFPRELLSRASAAYASRLTSAGGKAASRPQVDSLESIIHLEFRERRERLEPSQLSLEKASFADRVCEAVELLALAVGLGPVRWEVGPLERAHRFKGTDTVLEIGGRTLRIVAHHVHRGPAFPTFLRQVSDLPPGTLLVRDGAAGISGPVTSQLLEKFRQGRGFVHLPRPSLADLVAMGEMLAELREGNFARLDTEPAPTDENVKAALATLPWVTQGPLALALLELVRPAEGVVAGGKAPAATPPPPKAARAAVPRPQPTPSPPRSAPGAAPPPSAPTGGFSGGAYAGPKLAPGTPLPAAVETLLRAARWLMFERLRLWLSRQRLDAGVEDLRAILDSPPLSTTVLRYPSSVRSDDDVQILVWNGDDA